MDIGGAFSWAWNKFTQNAAPLVGVMLVAFIGVVIAFFVSIAIRASIHGSLFGVLLASALGNIVLFVVSGFLLIGVYQSALAVADGQPVDPVKMFSTDQLGNYLAAILLYGLAVFIGTILCFIPGLVAEFLFFLTPLFVLDQHLSPTEAMRASYEVTTKNVGSLLGFAILAVIVYAVGAIACGIGLLVTGPVALLATVHVYRGVTGRPVTV